MAFENSLVRAWGLMQDKGLTSWIDVATILRWMTLGHDVWRNHWNSTVVMIQLSYLLDS